MAVLHQLVNMHSMFSYLQPKMFRSRGLAILFLAATEWLSAVSSDKEHFGGHRFKIGHDMSTTVT